jgi:hypothetical protein
MNLTDFCSSLDAHLSSQSSEKERLETMAKAISQAFKVNPEEVAIFSFDVDQEMITFLWPLRLRNAGSLPLSAHNSLVTKTVRDKLATFDNSFSSTPHASIFEQFRLGPEQSPLPIQKIMSAPIFHDGEIKGVIQVSRKGLTGAEAGNDFATNQLAALTKVAEIAGRFI